MRQREVNSVYEATTKIYKINDPSYFQCFDRTYRVEKISLKEKWVRFVRIAVQ